MQAAAIVLAAGEGTRMRSAHPKVAHEYPRSPARALRDRRRARGRDRARRDGGRPPLGRGDAARRATPWRSCRRTSSAPAMRSSARGPSLAGFRGALVVLAGDVPLLRAETIRDLIATFESAGAACVMLTARFPDPTGYGRIVRDEDGGVTAIVEQKDLGRRGRSASTSATSASTASTPPRSSRASTGWNRRTRSASYYLTDVVALFRADGLAVARGRRSTDADESHGVNTRVQLARGGARHAAAHQPRAHARGRDDDRPRPRVDRRRRSRSGATWSSSP